MEISTLGLITVFAAGLISFLSPCVLPMVPGYISYICGSSSRQCMDSEITTAYKLHMLGLSGCFVLGFSTIFIILGASATTLGQWLLMYRVEANYLGGGIVIVFGLFMLGLIRIPWLFQDHRIHAVLSGGHPGSAYILGLAFGFGWTPCIGPVLGAVLTLGAVSASVTKGVSLLAIYSLGLGIPFLLSAMFLGRLLRRLKSLRKAGVIFYKVAGLIMILMGTAMITGYLSRFSYWLLSVFPVLGEIG